MSTAERQYLSCADTAKLVRGALKQRFPGQKFSVRSSTYAGGASIDVSWTDGPFTKDVDAVLHLYQGASFDGMIDLKSHHDSILVDEQGNPRVVSFGADFVMSQRTISPEYRAKLISIIEQGTGESYDPMKPVTGWYDVPGIPVPQGDWSYMDRVLYLLSQTVKP